MSRYDARAPAYPDYWQADYVYYDTPDGQLLYPAATDSVYDGSLHPCAPPETWHDPPCAPAVAYDAPSTWWSFEHCAASPAAVPALSRSDSLGSRTPPTPRTPDFAPRPTLDAPPPVKPEPEDGFVLERVSLLANARAPDAALPPNEVPLRATQAPPRMRRMMGVFRLNPFAPSPADAELDARPLDRPGHIITFQLEPPGTDPGPSVTLQKFEDDARESPAASSWCAPRAVCTPSAAQVRRAQS
ncbi:hypothetical protein HDZ31DRAFT_75618 [Schizophyllum fasciatum]